MGKPPSWLVEMFGCYVDGTPIAKRLFKRTNPERKYAGPVIISLNQQLCSAESIKIYLNERPVDNAELLLHLADKIETISARPYRGENDQKHTSFLTSDLFQEAFCEEVHNALTLTDIFRKQTFSTLLKNIDDELAHAGFGYRGNSFIHDVDKTVRFGDRLGSLAAVKLLRKMVQPDRPLRVAVPMGPVGAAVLFRYLKTERHIPLEISYEYAHAIEITHKIMEGRFAELPDLCVIGIAPAATLLSYGKKSGYEPIMLLPAMSHRVVAPATTSKRLKLTHAALLNTGDYFLLYDDFSTSLMYLNNLKTQGVINNNKVNIAHLEPDEVFEALSADNQDVRSVLYFPHCKLNTLYNGCTYLDDEQSVCRYKPFVLFAHQSLIAQPLKLQCLDIAIRTAWLELREDRSSLNQAVSHLLQDETFAKPLMRLSGLYQLQSASRQFISN